MRMDERPDKRKGMVMLERAENQSWAYDINFNSKEGLVLLDNVQFIYELSLAQLELRMLESSL